MKNRHSMVALAQEYLNHKRALGFALRVEGRELLKFASFADGSRHRGPLTLKLALQWAQLPREGSPLYPARRLDLVRRFAEYRAIFDPKTEVPSPGYLGPAYRRPPPFIYHIAEIRSLLKGARRLEPLRGLRPYSYATLIGLMACTGLRISEALRLQVSDVDLETGVLKVGRSKFHELRLVPMHASAVRALKRYRRRRDRQVTNTKVATFFLSEHGGPLAESTVHQTFSKLRTCLRRTTNSRAPRLHDFRHTFACRRLLLWCRNPGRVDHHIVWLSRYLGHRNIALTYWYFTGVPELFGKVATRFERYWHSQTHLPK